MDRFPGYYFSGDGGYKDEDSYIFITGRVDDIINVAGHRLSTAEMEEVVAAHPAVAECAVIGVSDSLRGEVPIGLVVLRAEANVSLEDLTGDLMRSVRNEIGAIACFRTVVPVQRLPKTRSGKILRRTMRAIANGESYQMPSTIEDPAVLDEIAIQFKRHHISKSGK
jgi:propionyl-CoA synthetase